RFTDEYDKAKNRFVKEFLSKYSLQDGSIDWDKLTRIISEIKPPGQKPEKPAHKKSKRNTSTIS
ncbi:MAG: hypothetical protein ACRD41_16440, partial [Candidatus Acidiferrales bacterium]